MSGPNRADGRFPQVGRILELNELSVNQAAAITGMSRATITKLKNGAPAKRLSYLRLVHELQANGYSVPNDIDVELGEVDHLKSGQKKRTSLADGDLMDLIELKTKELDGLVAELARRAYHKGEDLKSEHLRSVVYEGDRLKHGFLQLKEQLGL